MTIRLNGAPHELAGSASIAALLELLRIDADRVAVEHNRRIARRSEYSTTIVHEGDEVEIVNFVGGGARGHDQVVTTIPAVVLLNGKALDVRPDISVLELLQHLQIYPGRVIVERNGEVLARASYGRTRVSGGDCFTVTPVLDRE